MPPVRHVEVYVGDDQKRFRINENRLCRKIPYFANRVRELSAQGKRKIVELQNEDPAAFEEILFWVNGGKISCGFCDEDTASFNKLARLQHDLLWCNVHILARDFKLPAVCKMVAAIIKKCCLQIGQPASEIRQVIDHVYSTTDEDSDLRNLVTQKLVYLYFHDLGVKDSLFEIIEVHDEAKNDCLEGIDGHIDVKNCGDKECLEHRRSRRKLDGASIDRQNQEIWEDAPDTEI